VSRNGYVVNDENDMLAEVLSRAGFRAVAVLGSYALSSDFAFDAGFDVFDEDFDIGAVPGESDQEQRRAARVTDRALELIDAARADADRLFVFAHYFDPHAPYDPPAPYETMYHERKDINRATISLIGSMTIKHRRRLGDTRKEHRNTAGLSVDMIRRADGTSMRGEVELADRYAGEVSYMDEHVGRLLEGLDERGILDRALVVVTGDHGETFFEHADLWNHGLWVYDTTVRVPLIVRTPGGGGHGAVVEAPVSTIDVMPTILELVGLDAPARCQGSSLVAALEQRPLERGPVFAEATQPWRKRAPDRPWPNAVNPRCIRDGSIKLIHAPYLGDFEELYDLAADPEERVDLLRAPTARSEWTSCARPRRAPGPFATACASSSTRGPSRRDRYPATSERSRPRR
jgi:arylsulfatase A-like enzyme